MGSNKFCLNDNKKGKGLTQGKCGFDKKALWKFISLGGKYIIISKSKNVMNLRKGLKVNGNSIIAMHRHNGYNQKWLVDVQKNGVATFKNFYSSKCLDNSGSNKKGNIYIQWECKPGNENQIFYIINPYKKTTELTKLSVKQKISMRKFKMPSGWFNFLGDTGLCLTDNGKGKKVSQNKCTKKSNNFWKFVKISNELYSIVSKSGTVLTNLQSLKKNGNPIISWDNQKGNNQKWQVLPLANGKILLRNPEAAKCVDVDGNIKEDSKHILYECSTDKKMQQFSLKSLSGKSLKAKKEKIIKKKLDAKKAAKKVESIFKYKKTDEKSKDKKDDKNDKNKTCPCANKKNPFEPKKSPAKDKPKKVNNFKAPKGFVNIIGKDKLCIISASKGGIITQGKCGDYSDALWKVTKLEKGVFSIVSKNGNALENKEGKNAMNNPVVSNKYKKAPNQKWNFHNIKDKKIMIENSATKKCIDISKKAKAGNGYIINDCLKGNEGEHFRFQTAIGKVIKAKKISPKKKAKILKKKLMKKITDAKKRKKIQKKFNKLKRKIRKNSIKKGKKVISKKIKKLQKKGKKDKAKKLKKILKEVKKAPKKGKKNQKQILKKIKKATKKSKKAIQKRIKKLIKSGKSKKAEKLNKTLKKIIKKQKAKKIRKIAKRKARKEKRDKGKHLEYIGDPTKVNNKKLILPKGYINIVGKTGFCISNSHKPVKSLCSNKKKLIWRIIPTGANEFNIKNDNGIFLANKNGAKKNGNPIVAIKSNKGEKSKDPSMTWSFTSVGNGDYIIYNPKTKMCLDTTNKTNEGSGYKLMKCKEIQRNNNQLFSLNIIKPEYASKKKSDPELLKLGRKYVQIIGANNLCIKSTGEGSPLEQSKCENNDLELWRITPMGENEFYLQNKAGFQLSIRNSAKNPKGILGNHLTLNTEKFTIVNLKAGRFMLKNNSVNKCVDTEGKPKEGGVYAMFKCKNNDDGQTFKFREPTTVSVNRNWINIVGPGPEYLCVKNAGKGKKLVQATCNDSAEMLWKFEVLNGDTFIIVNKKDQSVFDLLNSKKFKGNAVVSFKRNNSKSQRWNIQHLTKGKLLIRNQISGRCFDNTGKAKINGLYRIWDCNKKSRNQWYRLQYARPGKLFIYFILFYIIYIIFLILFI